MEKLKKQSTIGIIFACGSAMAFGTYGLFQSFFLQYNISEAVITGLTPTVLLVYFFVKCLFQGKETFKVGKKYLIMMLINGGVVIYMMNFSMVKAFSLMPIGIVALFSFCNVILVMIASIFLFGYKLQKSTIACTGIAIIGVSLVMGIFGSDITFTGAGIFWLIMVLVFYAAYFISQKFYYTKGFETNQIMFYFMFAGAVASWFAAPPWKIVSEVMASIVTNGAPVAVPIILFILVTCIFCYETLGLAYQKTEAVNITLALALEPATASVLGAIFLGQSLNITQIIGIVICIAAISIIGYIDAKSEEKSPKDTISENIIAKDSR